MEADAIEGFIGEYGWMAAIAFVFLLGRNTIESAIEAIKVFAGDDLNTCLLYTSPSPRDS